MPLIVVRAAIPYDRPARKVRQVLGLWWTKVHAPPKGTRKDFSDSDADQGHYFDPDSLPGRQPVRSAVGSLDSHSAISEGKPT